MPQIVLDNSASKRQVKNTILIIVIAVVLIIVGFFLAFIFRKVDTTTDTAQVIASARVMSLKGDKAGALKILNTQLGRARTDIEKVKLNVAVGVNYESKSEYPAALAAYQRAQKLLDNYGTNSSVARVAEKTGDNATALRHYQRCLELSKDPDSHVTTSELKALNASIVRVGGSL